MVDASLNKEEELRSNILRFTWIHPDVDRVCHIPDHIADKIVQLFEADRDAAVREAQKLHVGDKIVAIDHTAVNKDAHLFIDGYHDPDLCPECIKPGTLSFQSQPNAKEDSDASQDKP